jgi:3-phosphoshikimate 1-carboxyvinyltransferase
LANRQPQQGINAFADHDIARRDGEMRGDLLVRSSELENVKIEADVIPNIIDEIPILSVAGLFAKGKFVIRGAQELRKKESDRIKSLCENYAKIGVEVNEFDDGFELIGEPKVKYGEFESFGDHRIAMTFAVLSMLLEEGGVVEDFECVEISNPAFIEQIQKISVA